jgi:hypothetical protein
MAKVIYFLCAIACLSCAYSLFRQYRATRVMLLFWSSVSFALLTFSNILLYIDLAVVPTIDLSIYRAVITLVALLILINALMKENAR